MVRRLAEPARNVRRALENLLALQRETDGVFSVLDCIQQMRSADHVSDLSDSQFCVHGRQ